MEPIELFKSLRDACDEMITALEYEDEAAVEKALANFLLLMVKLDAIA